MDPYLPVQPWRSRDEYEQWASGATDILVQRCDVETADIASHDPFSLPGYCIVCGARRSFWTGSLYSPRTLPDGRPVPNWREHLACDICGFCNRQRAAYHLLKQEVRPEPGARIYMTEFVTDFYQRIAKEYPGTVGSEYLGPGHQFGEVVDGVRHEDVQSLSFEDASLDVMISLDVLEHVPDETRAFREMARCLKPGGVLLMTAPTHIDHDDNEVRAVLGADGELTHLLEPEYHGNPVDHDSGSLCYRYFGWQVLDQLRRAGFGDARVLTYWSEDLRYYGEPQLAVLATR